MTNAAQWSTTSQVSQKKYQCVKIVTKNKQRTYHVLVLTYRTWMKEFIVSVYCQTWCIWTWFIWTITWSLLLISIKHFEFIKRDSNQNIKLKFILELFTVNRYVNYSNFGGRINCILHARFIYFYLQKSRYIWKRKCDFTLK